MPKRETASRRGQRAHAGLYREAQRVLPLVRALQAEVILLRFFAGESASDLAKRYGWPQARVEQAIREASAA